MDEHQEYISVQTQEGSIVEGTALLHNRNRLSELFNDISSRFIVMENITDELGRKKGRVFLNKDLIVWAAPRDVKHTGDDAQFSSTEYVSVSIKTIKDVTIKGSLNLQVFNTVFDMLQYTGIAPFVILINAQDTSGGFHHTLFVNKASVVQIEIDLTE
jgi:hypothetical protein